MTPYAQTFALLNHAERVYVVSGSGALHYVRVLCEPVCEPVCEPRVRIAALPIVLLRLLVLDLTQNKLKRDQHAAFCHFADAQTSKEFRPASQRVTHRRLSSC